MQFNGTVINVVFLRFYKNDVVKIIICLFFSLITFSQTKPLELKIDSIRSSDTADKAREYVLSFHITNLSDKPVSFVLNTKSIIPINSGSLRPYPYYKIYENDKSFEASGIFFSKEAELTFTSEEALKKYQDSIFHSIENKTLEELLKEKKERFINNIQSLGSKETMQLQTTLYWNKQRYYKSDPLEFYIEEKGTYYFELNINLMTEELLLDFSKEERNEILKDKNLTKGWYTSNKVPIDFSE